MISPQRFSLRSATLLVVAVLSVLALAGCTGAQSQPREYGEVNDKGDGYYGNFMYGCTGVEPTDGKYVGATLENPDFCRCVFEGLKEKVPFDQVTEFEEAQAATAEDDSEIEIPKPINEVRLSCADEATGTAQS